MTTRKPNSPRHNGEVKLNNGIQTWAPGQFIDHPQYRRMPDDWKAERRAAESHNVRPSPTDNPICHARDPAAAKWIASRLNLASALEAMTYDFATGKSDGTELVAFVRKKLDAI